MCNSPTKKKMVLYSGIVIRSNFLHSLYCVHALGVSAGCDASAGNHAGAGNHASVEYY